MQISPGLKRKIQIAMVAAIALTLRRRKDAKSQVISDQVAVQKADRLRIVTMQSESKIGM